MQVSLFLSVHINVGRGTKGAPSVEKNGCANVMHALLHRTWASSRIHILSMCMNKGDMSDFFVFTHIVAPN